jgi:uncharacterized protein YbjQ (UPF0145 family)
MDLIIFLALVAAGYGVGSWMEKKHYSSIEKREAELLELPIITIKNGFEADRVNHAGLVQGSAVISVDYFKRILASLRNFFGGTIRSYETLIDRARREAILRMKESVPAGTRMIVNVRVETSTIGRNSHQKSVSCVEAIAYGTALGYVKMHNDETP